MTDELSSNDNMEVEGSLNIGLNSDHLTLTDQKSSDSEDENEISFTRIRTKLKQFTESDSDTDNGNDNKKSKSPQKSSSDENTTEILTYKKKSRIKSITTGSDSETQAENDDKVPLSTASNYDLTRTKIKNKKLQDKFKKLKNPTKGPLKENLAETRTGSDSEQPNEASDCSDAEISCLNIKQKFTKKSSHNLSAICDPDTSDEESNISISNNSKQQKSKPRSIKLTSPKAVRMSAKQAMENMHKIKSESNRMLREREVSLPYHRPKALNLKDIMSRRRPALTSDGKSLPIKMNSEQLQQYALLLEQRQKEMMELCKSDTEEEEDNCQEENSTSDVQKIENGAEIYCKEIDSEINANKEDVDSPLDISDKLYDDLNTELNTNKSKSNDINEEVAVELVVINESKPENPSEQSENDASTTEKEEAMEIDNEPHKEAQSIDLNKNTEEDSDIVILHYDSERTEALDVQDEKPEGDKVDESNMPEKEKKDNSIDEFSDNDFTMDELDKIIEHAENVNDKSSKSLSNLEATLDIKPKLTGVPGTFIDLDDDDCSNTQKKLTGVELLKERFTYFAKLQSAEDMEKDREKKYKPGTQHLKLRQALEEQIAEQRSLEWEKRLEVENQLKAETKILDNEQFDGEDIEKIEAKLEENDNPDEESSSEEELEEDDCDLKEKPRKRNPMVDDEAEVSDDDDPNTENIAVNEGDAEDECEDDDADNDDSDDEDDSSDSDQDETEVKPKKGRILKAFEDSDDEDLKEDIKTDPVVELDNQDIQESQDDEIQLGQLQKSYSEDLFSSQANSEKSNTTDKPKDADTSLENDLGYQTFSILKSGMNNIDSEKDVGLEKLDVICETQPCSGDNFDAIAGMCTGAFLENLVTPQESSTQLSQSQEIGDDVAALCTGKFYDNPFISQTDENENVGNITENDIADESIMSQKQTDDNISEAPNDSTNPIKSNESENKLLKSILDELGDPEFDSPKPNKYFFSGNKTDDDKQSIDNTQLKKKFVIESDDETNEGAEVAKKKKKRKKRKLEDRALQISDDEDEEYSEQEGEEYASDIENDNDRLVEYDSEENEVEVQAKAPKKKRIGNEFFEQEAELTSEDEWIGSGDEDEAGLDRMEREAGDDDTFHQGKLQRELGEIHMREVLDQDKREVRLLQELLFEDGDLGDGHRQRKFRWKNADGEEEMGTNADEYADTQEDEFESEEQWRKQRHEREMFLRTLQEKDEEDANVSINRSAIIKANICSKSTSSLLEKTSALMEKPKTIETEKKTLNDIPSPKKPFTIFQSNYHNSLLTRGRGALARLAALATPLAGDGEDGPKVNASSNRGNFVFATLTPDETEPKVTKRKAEANPDTPRLLKKMKKQEINTFSKSILDHL